MRQRVSQIIADMTNVLSENVRYPLPDHVRKAREMATEIQSFGNEALEMLVELRTSSSSAAHLLAVLISLRAFCKPGLLGRPQIYSRPEAVKLLIDAVTDCTVTETRREALDALHEIGISLREAWRARSLTLPITRVFSFLHTGMLGNVSRKTVSFSSDDRMSQEQVLDLIDRAELRHSEAIGLRAPPRVVDGNHIQLSCSLTHTYNVFRVDESSFVYKELRFSDEG